MKRISVIGLLILFAMMLLAMVLQSCDDKVGGSNYTAESTEQLNQLKSPVILFAVHDSWAGYSIVVRDGDGKFVTIGNMSSLANAIGQSRHIGDTIK